MSRLVRDLREKFGISQNEFAEILGLASGTVISRWERGERSPDEVVYRFLRYLLEVPEAEGRRIMARVRSYGAKRR